MRINNAKTGAANPNAEWIAINNDGELTWQLVGWELSDETGTQQRPHIYLFPPRIGNGAWQFEPGETVFVFTGIGADQFIASPSGGGRPQFHFFMNRRAMVWNNSGDRVFLRNSDGTFVTQPFPIP